MTGYPLGYAFVTVNGGGIRGIPRDGGQARVSRR
jgi:hypothetical protein